MGGERERAEFAAFEALLSNCIADALVPQLRKEAEAHGVDVVTWLKRDKSTPESGRMRHLEAPQRTRDQALSLPQRSLGVRP